MFHTDFHLQSQRRQLMSETCSCNGWLEWKTCSLVDMMYKVRPELHKNITFLMREIVFISKTSFCTYMFCLKSMFSYMFYTTLNEICMTFNKRRGHPSPHTDTSGTAGEAQSWELAFYCVAQLAPNTRGLVCPRVMHSWSWIAPLCRIFIISIAERWNGRQVTRENKIMPQIWIFVDTFIHSSGLFSESLGGLKVCDNIWGEI